MNQIRVTTPGKSYTIWVESGLFKDLPEIFQKTYQGKKLGLVCDNKVHGLYGHEFSESLQKTGFSVTSILFDEGEQNKSLVTLQSIYTQLAQNAFTRSDYIVALGGGVTGDMAGLAAATFLRGMGFIQIPTTLLAMVDSSVGGKVAVDLPQGKNLIGAFYQPDAVYTDPSVLKSLSDRRFSDGMAELLKHGFIFDARLIEELTAYGSRQQLEPHMDEFVAKSCAIKRDVVEQDEQDNGIRQTLNFGHTIGHSIEKVQNFTGHTHGEAIAVGMVLMTRITEKMGLTQMGTAQKVQKVLEQFGLPTAMPEIPVRDLIDAIQLDKKSRSGKITIAYIEQIGRSGLHTLSINELGDRINGVLND